MITHNTVRHTTHQPGPNSRPDRSPAPRVRLASAEATGAAAVGAHVLHVLVTVAAARPEAAVLVAVAARRAGRPRLLARLAQLARPSAVDVHVGCLPLTQVQGGPHATPPVQVGTVGACRAHTHIHMAGQL